MKSNFYKRKAKKVTLLAAGEYLAFNPFTISL